MSIEDHCSICWSQLDTETRLCYICDFDEIQDYLDEKETRESLRYV